jgi:hypothetical protein
LPPSTVGGLHYLGYFMSNASIKTSTVFVTAPHVLSKAQRDDIIDRTRQQLPPDVGVVVLDGGIVSVVAVPSTAPVSVEAISGELLEDRTNVLILEELRALRKLLEGQMDMFTASGAMRVKS